MYFKKREDDDKLPEEQSFSEEELKNIQENREKMNWDDILAFTIAGFQLLLPMALLLVLSCVIVSFVMVAIVS